jgi:AcrR family transcriptional regulator
MQRAVTEHAKDRRRSSLLKAALDEFFHQGFKRARMEDIARGAGLSRGTLYLYFTSKQALFMALFEEVAIVTVSTVSKQAMGAASAPQALQQLMQSIPQTYSHCALAQISQGINKRCQGSSTAGRILSRAGYRPGIYPAGKHFTPGSGQR